jgi:type VI secretion system secreted protein VgrG
MRQILGFTMALILWSPAKSYAAEGSVPQQLELMRRQVAALQREVALLKSALQISDAGGVHVVARRDKRETVGGNSVTEIGGNLQESIGGSHSETVGGNNAITIGADQSTSVGRDLELKSSRNANQAVGQDLSITAGKEIVINAGDELILKTGQASIILKKNGDITINGTDIRAKASGELDLRGAKIRQN